MLSMCLNSDSKCYNTQQQQHREKRNTVRLNLNCARNRREEKGATNRIKICRRFHNVQKNTHMRYESILSAIHTHTIKRNVLTAKTKTILMEKKSRREKNDDSLFFIQFCYVSFRLQFSCSYSTLSVLKVERKKNLCVREHQKEYKNGIYKQINALILLSIFFQLVPDTSK